MNDTKWSLRPGTPWQHTGSKPFPLPAEDLQAEVVIVGAGITGLTAAYLLARAGIFSVLIERAQIGLSGTGHTTAHLVTRPDVPYHKLIEQRGMEEAQLVHRGLNAALDLIEQLVEAEHIDAHFARVDQWLIALEEQHRDQVEREAQALRELGVNVEQPATAPFPHAAALRHPRQGRFHPGRYLAGLAAATERHSVHLHENMAVTSMHFDGYWHLNTNVGRAVHARKVILATQVPVLTEYPLMHGLTPKESFVIGALAPQGTVPDVLTDDTRDPYHYYRIEPQGDADLVIFGGEDRETGAGPGEANETRFEALWDELQAWLPNVDLQPNRKWVNEMWVTDDGLPWIGEDRFADHEGRFIATGYAGVGMTFGTLAGMIAADWAAGRTSEFARPFDTSRLPSESPKLLEEHARHQAQESLQQATRRQGVVLERGQGAVTTDDRGQPRAVYLDEHGRVHERSAVCTHRGCAVEWNAADRTWDCPCHGSRFSPKGDVLYGPAVEGLTSRDRSSD